MKAQILLFFFILLVGKSYCQVIPDSLVGTYAGKLYSHKDFEDWSLEKLDTMLVKKIDTVNCNVIIYGTNQICYYDCLAKLFSDYSFCNTYYNPSISINGPSLKFYSIDSVVIDLINVGGPPNYTMSYLKFEGKRISSLILNNSENKANEFKIFPNPMKNELNIEFANYNLESKFEIINEIGQSVYSSVITKKTMVDLSKFSRGIYFVKLFTNDKFYCKKIVKE